MLIGEGDTNEARPFYRNRVKQESLLSLLLLILAVALLSINASTSASALVVGAQLSALGALILGAAAFATGVRRFLRARPEFRRPFLYVGAIALAVLLMHLYIVNSPPTAVAATVSGKVDTTFSDQRLQVSSILAGTLLRVSVTDLAGADAHAVAQVQVYLDNVSLASSVLIPVPTYATPLEPSSAASIGYTSTTVGQWTVQGSPQSTVKVDYQYLTCFHVPEVKDSRAVYGCVMDESYYVPSAMGILSGAQCAQFADSCNLEHPPLAKALVAGGMAVFGVNDLGWRVANMVMGTLSIPLLFGLTLSLTSNRRLSYFAALILAADAMFFVHSSAALIDVPSVFFSLLGFIFYFRRVSLWRVSNYVVSGLFFGLAALSKETALFALATVATYEVLFSGSGFRASIKKVVTIVAPAVVLFAGVVQLYDSLFTHSSQPWFYQHISFMLSYGSSLRGGGWIDPYLGRYINPLDWLLAYSPVSYLVTTITETVSGVTSSTLQYVSVGYYGIANQVIVWMVFTWVPIAAYKLVKNRGTGATLSIDDRFLVFLTVWFLWSYVPYLALWLYGRVTYPFYILPAIPALAAGAAYFITRDWFPRKMAIFYLVAAFAIFFLYFPVKDFLPVFVRAWLAH